MQNLFNIDFLDYSSQLYQPTEAFSFSNYLNIVGDKRYELSNHLGNVLEVINDKKIPNVFRQIARDGSIKSVKKERAI